MPDPADYFAQSFIPAYQQSASLAQQSRSLAEQQREFDIVQNLRQHAQDTQDALTTAQISGIQANAQIAQINAKQAQFQYDHAPDVRQAQVDLNDAINYATQNATGADDFPKLLRSQIASNPSISTYLPPTTVNSLVQDATLQFNNGTLAQLNKQQAIDNQKTLIQAQTLGVDTDQFVQKDANGQPLRQANGLPQADWSGLRSAVNQASIVQNNKAAQFKNDLETQRQQDNIRLRTVGQLQAVEARMSGNEGKIQDLAQRTQYRELNQNYRKKLDELKTLDPESDEYERAKGEALDFLNQAQQVYGKATGDTNHPAFDLLGKVMQDFSVAPPGSFSGTPASPSAENAPEASTEKPQAMGGYKIGSRYGSLTYLGGDPNVRSSWQ